MQSLAASTFQKVVNYRCYKQPTLVHLGLQYALVGVHYVLEVDLAVDDVGKSSVLDRKSTRLNSSHPE